MTFRNSREHCGRLDCACSAKRSSSFPRSCVHVLTAVIWRRSMELFGSFVAQVYKRHQIFVILKCLGRGLAEGRV